MESRVVDQVSWFKAQPIFGSPRSPGTRLCGPSLTLTTRKDIKTKIPGHAGRSCQKGASRDRISSVWRGTTLLRHLGPTRRVHPASVRRSGKPRWIRRWGLATREGHGAIPCTGGLRKGTLSAPRYVSFSETRCGGDRGARTDSRPATTPQASWMGDGTPPPPGGRRSRGEVCLDCPTIY